MAGMDDLFDSEGIDALVDGALADDDETQKFTTKTLTKPKSRKGLHTPILSGKNMARGADKAAHSEDDTMENIAEAQAAAGGAGVPQMTLDTIFKRAGLATDHDSFTVYKLERLYNDEEIIGLDENARVAAVRAILKSHDVELSRIFDDAVARREALENHDERLKQNISRVEEQVRQENAALQAEIEEFANPRLQRMEANEQRLERLRRDYHRWHDRKQTEQGRLVQIVRPWGGDDRLKNTERVPALPATQPGIALSGQDVFDDPPGPAIAGAPPAASPRDQWSLGETSSGAVETELPSEFHAASTRGATDTDEFDFVRPPVRIMPASALEGLAAALAIVVWAIGGILLTAQLVTDLRTGAAWGIALGAPLVLAIIMAVVLRNGGWATSFFMMLFYFSVVAIGVAHYNPQNLVESLTRKPLLFVEDAGLPPEFGERLSSLTTPYAELLADSLGLSLPKEQAPSQPS